VRSDILTPDGTATKGGLPAIFIASDKNLGFSGGNNLGFDLALRDEDEFIYLLNPTPRPSRVSSRRVARDDGTSGRRRRPVAVISASRH